LRQVGFRFLLSRVNRPDGTRSTSASLRDSSDKTRTEQYITRWREREVDHNVPIHTPPTTNLQTGINDRRGGSILVHPSIHPYKISMEKENNKTCLRRCD